MKLNCLIIVIIVQFCAASKNDANLRRLKDWFKNVTDPTFECPPTSGKKSDPEVGANILAVVDCDDVGARPEFKFKVIKLVFLVFFGAFYISLPLLVRIVFVFGRRPKTEELHKLLFLFQL